MFDTFPYESWFGPDGKTYNTDINGFWTWGPGNSTGTYVLTVLGAILMVASLIAWVWLENKKLTAQAAQLRAAESKGG